MFGESEMKGCLKKSVMMLVGCLASMAGTSHVLAQVSLDDISFATLPGARFEVKMSFSEPPPSAEGYTIDNPARIVLDLPGVSSGVERKHSLSFENARSAVVLGTADRTRLILNMLQMAPYETRVEGNVMTLVVGASELATGGVDKKSPAVSVKTEGESRGRSEFSIKSVDFRRGERGEGRWL